MLPDPLDWFVKVDRARIPPLAAAVTLPTFAPVGKNKGGVAAGLVLAAGYWNAFILG